MSFSASLSYMMFPKEAPGMPSFREVARALAAGSKQSIISNMPGVCMVDEGGTFRFKGYFRYFQNIVSVK